MESWVNQVLAGPAEQHSSGLPNQAPLQPGQAAFKGLLKHGLTKAELAHAGLGAEAVDRLYRTLYVYSLGLFDTLQVRAQFIGRRIGAQYVHMLVVGCAACGGFYSVGMF
jgi:hypothetical protein